MPDLEPVRPSIRSQGRVPSSSRLDTRFDRLNTNDDSYMESPSSQRPNATRASTFQGPTAIYRESPISATSRQNSQISEFRGQLRQTSRANTGAPDLFGDPSDESTLNSASPDRSYGARSVSPATSHGSTGAGATTNGRKGPPPPPPTRGKKPPPPPPLKRAEISSSNLTRY